MLLLNKSCLKSYCYGAFCDLKPNKLNISFMYLYISHQCWLSRAIFFPLEIWLNYFSICCELPCVPGWLTCLSDFVSYNINLMLLCRKIMVVLKGICWPTLGMHCWSNVQIACQVLDWLHYGKIVIRVTFSIDWQSLKVTKFFKDLHLVYHIFGAGYLNIFAFTIFWWSFLSFK